MQVGFSEESQRPVGFLLVSYMEKTEQFQFVDESFFTFFCSFGDRAQPTNILAKKCDDHVRLAVFYAV